MTLWARVRFTKTGMHQYPEAKENVRYLRDMHRHVFHFTVDVEQFHDDRDIEYLTLKDYLEAVFLVGDVGRCSCEMLAERMRTVVQEKYGHRRVRVEVSEDGENGAVLE